MDKQEIQQIIDQALTPPEHPRAYYNATMALLSKFYNLNDAESKNMMINCLVKQHREEKEFKPDILGFFYHLWFRKEIALQQQLIDDLMYELSCPTVDSHSYLRYYNVAIGINTELRSIGKNNILQALKDVNIQLPWEGYMDGIFYTFKKHNELQQIYSYLNEGLKKYPKKRKILKSLYKQNK